ncbi:EAL domain-containing protein [Clostridium sp. 'White wine YQ']|uniref:EAL domain-containing protein n=1 Tax=Clostridium sp. 'White wine YQ' TaxID=3027474 RepID=UPI0023672E67|nr:EAL domain-containing protein [Clostridium sp. 'White wine YQ']MDD7795453.1 EAL domain-containing protein [Clostridium sp. 'White wine YQ']
MVYSVQFIRAVIENMINAFSYNKIITDELGNVIDYEIIEVNKAFESASEMRRENILGKRIKEEQKNSNKEKAHWFEFYNDVSICGKCNIIERYSQVTNKWYLINTYSIEKGYFVLIFIDVTAIKERQLELEEKNSILNKQVEELERKISVALEKEKRQKRAQEIGNLGSWELDLTTGNFNASEEAFKLYGLKENRDIIKFEDLNSNVHVDDKERKDKAFEDLICGKGKYDIEYRIIREDTNEIRYIHSIADVEKDVNGNSIRVIGVVNDITDKINYEIGLSNKNQELEALYEQIAASEEELTRQLQEIQESNKLLELSEERYKTLVNSSQDMIYSCDVNGVFTTVNQRFCEMMKLKLKDIIGKTMGEIVNKQENSKKWDRVIQKVISSGETIITENKYVAQNGRTRYFNVTLCPIFDGKDNVIGVTGTNHDITTLKEHELTITHMAYHDNLTSLPNRNLFLDKLKEAIANSNVNNTKVAVLFLDVDNFKKVNDTLGHSVGDELLLLTTQRLSECVNEKNLIARLGGDEFSILFENINKVTDIIDVVEDINKLFTDDFNINENFINLSASIGISVYPDDGQTAEDLMKNSETAMYRAKELGKNTYQIFNVNMKEELIKKISIEGMIRTGLKKKEFLLYYQPQYQAKTRKLRGFEALIRWNNPVVGFLSPLEFIPIAEETGLIVQLGEWVLNTAAEMYKNIKDKYGIEVIMSVNISPIQLRQKNFVNLVLGVIDRLKIKPENLELEITESVFIDNFDNSIETLKRLRNYGIRIALDDFGTGYSSLSYLKKLPISILKIDKSFVDEIDENNKEAILTDSIISLVHKLNIETIAEGVEDEYQLEYLEKAECDNFQGYYLGKPMPAEMIEKVIKFKEIDKK